MDSLNGYRIPFGNKMNEFQILPPFSNLIKFRVDARTMYWVSQNVFFQRLEGEESAFWKMTSIQRLQFSDVAIIGGALVKLRTKTVEELMDEVIGTKDVFENPELPANYIKNKRIIGKRSR
jgi:hypothetical protein